ncbi:MAG TPA: lipopolysaccharide assembly protein LapB [Usitatibacter sp.]|nr:lipopolysaccharide assembly protein LapB [Usitatibacter sp.]
MEFEFWWLLALPLFFGMGWIAARVDIKSLLSESRALPSSYFRGLNFLLNEQPDKAIESFLQVAKENPQTVELQFALGSLFRRRGEVDRAIRMHQDLVKREDLPADERRQATFELSQDYFKAGLLDHAEEVLERLGETDPSEEVHRNLLDIYIQEKDWQKAIDAARRLEVSARRNYTKEIANYHCELAITAHVHGRAEDAEAELARALAANRKCVRANLLRGEWLARDGRHEEAIEAWKSIESQDPAYIGIAAEGMVESYKAIGRPEEGLTLLRGLQHRYPGLDLLNVVYQITAEIEGDEAAYRLVRDEVRRNPTLVGLDRLIDAELVRAAPERRQDLQLMKNLVHSHAQALAVYLCGNCGFKARQFFWQCPACGGWETFPPRRTAELDSAGRHLARMQIGQ